MKKEKETNAIDLNKVYISRETAELISPTLAKRYCLIPIKKAEGKIYIAMEDPLNFIAIEDVKAVSGLDVIPLAASRDAIEGCINRLYGIEPAEKAVAEYQKEYRTIRNNDDIDGVLSDTIDNAPIVRLINSLIEQAVSQRASEIHIEPMEDKIRIRMRIDGLLQTIMTIPLEAHGAISTRIKIMGSMNIAEKRMPQDGRCEISVMGRAIDIRISMMPTVHGEKVVLRILDRSNFLFPKEALGFSQENIEKFNQLLKIPHGIILITGPTGSGKSTTLYTMLNEINNDYDNIITIEDPVEYLLPGLNQIQINAKAGLIFSSALRYVLRQDPDVIMVGEIRDQETAEMAIRAAITGHLVLSTVHTNDAAGAISRLIDMGVEPYLLADALAGVISQRLIRRVCKDCQEPYRPESKILEEIGWAKQAGEIFYRGTGCTICNHTGYRGRMAIHEVLMVTKGIREMIVEGQPTEKIKNQAIREGMRTLQEEALEVLYDGRTSMEEIVSLLYGLG